MKKITLLFIATLILTGCKNSLKESDEYFLNQADNVIGNDLVFLTTTINFLYYANPINYWYPDEYTLKDILNDKYQMGYRGLNKLKEDIHSIPDKDSIISEAIEELEMEIKFAQKDIKKKQIAIENANGLFGMMSYGGLSGIMDLDNAFSTEEEIEAREEKGRAMPENVETAFNNLIEVLYFKYSNVAGNIYKLEEGAFELTKPSVKDKTLIRLNLKALIRKKICLLYDSQDTISRDEMINRLFDYYDNEFKISDN